MSDNKSAALKSFDKWFPNSKKSGLANIVLLLAHLVLFQFLIYEIAPIAQIDSDVEPAVRWLAFALMFPLGFYGLCILGSVIGIIQAIVNSEI